MASYLLDTNHFSAALRPVSALRDRLTQAMRAGHRIGTCIPVLCEIEVGLQQLQQPQRYRRTLDHLLSRIRIWPLDRSVALEYGILYNDLRQQGRVLSQVDMMLAAQAIVMGLTLLTSDRDFDAVRKLQTEDWIV
jgi:tRNA(fMet)-specific endonuclease VapC